MMYPTSTQATQVFTNHRVLAQTNKMKLVMFQEPSEH